MTISNESKNALAVTNENKGRTNKTWATAEGTWEEQGDSTWENQFVLITKESKNALAVTNENKN